MVWMVQSPAVVRGYMSLLHRSQLKRHLGSTSVFSAVFSKAWCVSAIKTDQTNPFR
jgi:hypothetical protein